MLLKFQGVTKRDKIFETHIIQHEDGTFSLDGVYVEGALVVPHEATSFESIADVSAFTRLILCTEEWI